MLALIAIFALIAVAIGAAFVLGGLPGRIAVKRGHAQADAIRVCGWVGLLTGVLWTIAIVWAFLKPRCAASSVVDEGADDLVGMLADQIVRLEATVTLLEQRQQEVRS